MRTSTSSASVYLASSLLTSATARVTPTWGSFVEASKTEALVLGLVVTVSMDADPDFQIGAMVRCSFFDGDAESPHPGT